MGAYDATLGPILVGAFLNTYLYGLVSLRFLTYYTSAFEDPLWIRAIVSILFVTDTVHSASLIYLVWVCCVANFTNPEILLLHTIWPYPFTPIAIAIGALATHIFLGYRLVPSIYSTSYAATCQPPRIYRFTQLKILFGFICTIAMAIFIMGFIVGIEAWTITYDAEQSLLLSTLAICWLGLQVGLDVSIAAIMSFCLYRLRSSFWQTNTVIYRLMRVAIQTGFFCTVFAMGNMISLLTIPKSTVYATFSFVMGRIYTNTVMDILNMRDALKVMLYATQTGAIPTHIEPLRFEALPSVANTDFELGQTSPVTAKAKEKEVALASFTNSSASSNPKFELDGKLGAPV
ncbi:hypothetical protein AX15_002452 [Amanita polypyramis BW_CC]|nr:hypothetical protein AX15_002452 [Amanita polypyramis BW_CC]